MHFSLLLVALAASLSHALPAGDTTKAELRKLRGRCLVKDPKCDPPLKCEDHGGRQGTCIDPSNPSATPLGGIDNLCLVTPDPKRPYLGCKPGLVCERDYGLIGNNDGNQGTCQLPDEQVIGTVKRGDECIERTKDPEDKCSAGLKCMAVGPKSMHVCKDSK